MSLKEISIAKINDINEGEMKAFKINEELKILLIKNNGKISALGANCTHYGAPLEEGVLCGEVIICPWHHACFNAETGNLVEPPARDSLPSYQVKIDGENIIVNVPEPIKQSHIPYMTKEDVGKDKRSYVIIGGGAAGNAAAQALREADYAGKIIMITQENRVPYDRPNLSKDYLQGEAQPEWMPLRSDDFYKEYGIEIKFYSKVESIDFSTKVVLLESGERVKYDKLLLAKGGIPRKLEIEGSELKNIFYLRSFDDTDKIIVASENAKSIAVIGASFIAMETAFSLHERRKVPITIIGMEKVPFEKVFGKEIGMFFQTKHEAHGINFKLNRKPIKIEGKERAESILLDNNERINVDLVIVGVGVKPATDFIKNLHLEDDGSIKVDKYFQAAEDVFASGDIVKFPYKKMDSFIRIEHWRIAEQQGRIAGFNMAGKKVEFDDVPFFWTVQAGTSLRYVGYSAEWDEIITWGEIPSESFISFFVKDKKVHAAAGIGHDKEMAAIQCLIRNNKMPSIEKLRSKSIDLLKIL